MSIYLSLTAFLLASDRYKDPPKIFATKQDAIDADFFGHIDRLRRESATMMDWLGVHRDALSETELFAVASLRESIDNLAFQISLRRDHILEISHYTGPSLVVDNAGASSAVIMDTAGIRLRLPCDLEATV